MSLTDTFVRTAKCDKPAGQKHADGNGMYLLVTPSGKYWRLDYRHFGTHRPGQGAAAARSDAAPRSRFESATR